jgi:hypothetical protein
MAKRPLTIALEHLAVIIDDLLSVHIEAANPKQRRELLRADRFFPGASSSFASLGVYESHGALLTARWQRMTRLNSSTFLPDVSPIFGSRDHDGCGRCAPDLLLVHRRLPVRKYSIASAIR